MRRHARVDDRHADAAAGEAAQAVESAPHLPCAGRLRRDGHHPLDPRVAGDVIDVEVLGERRELAARDVEHGAAAQRLLHARSVARHEHGNLLGGPRHDDARCLGAARCEALREIVGKPGMTRGAFGGGREDRDDHERRAGAAQESCA